MWSGMSTQCFRLSVSDIRKICGVLNLSLLTFHKPTCAPSPYPPLPLRLCLYFSLFSLPSVRGWTYPYSTQVLGHQAYAFIHRQTPCRLVRHTVTWHLFGSYETLRGGCFACISGTYSVMFRHLERHTEHIYQKKSAKANENMAQLPSSIVCGHFLKRRWLKHQNLECF